ncbi:hypothetical protein L596_009340 [Steinernema carpocapsae]|uniref:C2H2-type domain-containing protein n=1 Tax=Steinernema carpocapsae TaxID=34508 RepID=A0A4U5PFV3_STECR|nr:hypothetical protein L596_009340 [Steinernema carpocapsae]
MPKERLQLFIETQNPDIFTLPKFRGLKTEEKVDFLVYHHFRFQPEAVKEFIAGFSPEKMALLEEFSREATIPRIERMIAHVRLQKMKAKKKYLAAVFECQTCHKQYRGCLNDLRKHVGMHVPILVDCVLEGCDGRLLTYDSLLGHLKTYHGLKISDLEAHNYHELQLRKAKYFREADKHLEKLFPPESFVAFADRRRRSEAKLEDSRCHKCEDEVKSILQRRRHVAEHLNLFQQCILDDCEECFWLPSDLVLHLMRHHEKRLVDLTEDELFDYKTFKISFNETIKEEVPKFFSTKEISALDSTFEVKPQLTRWELCQLRKAKMEPKQETKETMKKEPKEKDVKELKVKKEQNENKETTKKEPKKTKARKEKVKEEPKEKNATKLKEAIKYELPEELTKGGDVDELREVKIIKGEPMEIEEESSAAGNGEPDSQYECPVFEEN